MDNIIAQETGTEAVATAAMPESEEERRLVDEIVGVVGASCPGEGRCQEDEARTQGHPLTATSNKNNFWPFLAATPLVALSLRRSREMRPPPRSRWLSKLLPFADACSAVVRSTQRSSSQRLCFSL